MKLGYWSSYDSGTRPNMDKTVYTASCDIKGHYILQYKLIRRWSLQGWIQNENSGGVRTILGGGAEVLPRTKTFFKYSNLVIYYKYIRIWGGAKFFRGGAKHLRGGAAEC